MSIEDHSADAWYMKELRSFVNRFVIFVLHLFVLYFNAHVHISSLASPLKVRNFFIIWFIGLWSLCTLCMCMSMCMCVCTCLWIFPTEAPLTPAHWYQREFIFYIWAEGSKVPSTLNTSNKKKSVEMTKNNIWKMTTLFLFFLFPNRDIQYTKQFF